MSRLCSLPLGAIGAPTAAAGSLGGSFHDLTKGVPYTELTIGVPKENYPNERLVQVFSLSPLVPHIIQIILIIMVLITARLFIVRPHRRVAQTPETTAKFVKEGIKVNVEAGAGIAAGFSDEMVRRCSHANAAAL